MKKVADFVCKNKLLILIITCIIFVLSIIGYKLTGVNYDILVYLPKDIETVEGQDILTNEFNMGAYTVVITKNLNSKEIINLKKAYTDIEGVNNVLSVYDLIGLDVPIDMLPSDVVSHVHDENTDIMFVTFNEGTSSDATINAIREMRKVSNDKALISGMSSMVVDTMDLSESEIVIYIIIAVLLCLIVLEIFLDSYLAPVLLLINIGISIIFNLGTNIIFGEISYITKALVAVLQLGVTMDFSIFLYHAYEFEKEKSKSCESAMKEAILKTFKSVTGSSITTIVGFLALCAMDLTLGKDLGLVMAKGVLIGVICVLTVFPSMLLLFDKLILKTKHKALKINFEWLNKKVVKHYKLIFVVFIILIIPFYLANSKVPVYYKIDSSLPDTLESIVANKEISERFNIVSPEILLIPNDLKIKEENNLLNEIKNVEGIDFVLSSSSLSDFGLTNDMLPSQFNEALESENYRLVLINSLYEVASNELNEQVDEVNSIISKYDDDIILAGEGALMKDLVLISDNDFKNVNTFSIVLVLIVMFIVLKSLSLPILLVITIEFAIFVNMGISYFGGSVLPFVAPIVLGTIQLGATIDYAILLTTNYLKNRKILSKEEAMITASNYCTPSILVSGLCFFAATFGVGVYSKLEMVGALCSLISRGAIISMIVVILILPSVLLLFDKLINVTTIKDKEGKKNMKKRTYKAKKLAVLVLALSIAIHPFSVFALTKDETVYGKLDATGKTQKVIVNDYLKDIDTTGDLEDYSDLDEIVNLSGDEVYSYSNNKLIWKSNGNDILYQGTTNKILPIGMNISYKLDGEEKLVNDIIGKSGKIEITVKYTNNDLHTVQVNGQSEKMYTPFVVTTATSLNNEYNKNINVLNGKVIDNGNSYLIAGISAPGLYESLNLEEIKDLDKITITFDTTKFELSSIYSVITPKLIDNEDLTIFNKMDKMYANIDELQKNMDVLESSAKTISSNLNVVSDNTNLVYSSLNTVLKNVSELKNGTMSLDSGLKTLLDNLNNAKANLSSPEMAQKLAGMQELYKVDNAQIQSIKSKNSELKANYDKYGLANITYEQILATQNMDLYNLKYTYENFYTTNESLITLLSTNANAINESLKAINSMLSSVDTMINTVSGYMTEVSNGATKINNGVIALEQGIDLLTSNVGKLNSGVKELAAGTNKFSIGMSQFNDNGINELTKIKNKASSVTKKMDKLVILASDYKTFTASNENADNSVKFIYAIDSIKVKEPDKEPIKSKEKDTFLDRIQNLFN